MFTIKHVETDSGHESLMTYETVSYDSGDTRSTSHPGSRGVRGLGKNTDPDGATHYLSGDVYIMNEQGATVGIYRQLGPIPKFDHAEFHRHFPNVTSDKIEIHA